MHTDLKELTPREIERYSAETLRQKPGAGARVAAWLYRKRAAGFDSMADLNRPLRALLNERARISELAVEHSEESADGTRKLLYRLEDGNSVEGALIPGRDRLTLCVSTQAGCASGCTFCLTGRSGFLRNLSHAEMVNQVFAAERRARGAVISNIVLMGTGEPLGNYGTVKRFVETATHPAGLALSPKRVTISTCGLAPMIERLADDGVAASLAVSLNAASDAVRDRIMPVNRAYPLTRLMESLRYYTERTGRTVTIEYVLFKGVNDTASDAKRLHELLADLPCMVNLLPFNPFPGATLERPDAGQVSVFRDVLVREGRIAVVRKSRGGDISAACGQLRAARAAR